MLIELPTIKVAGSPTMVNRPALLATNTIKISSGTKLMFSSAAMGGISGASSITVVALGSMAQTGVVIATMPSSRRLPSPRAMITIWVARYSKILVGSKARTITITPKKRARVA